MQEVLLLLEVVKLECNYDDFFDLDWLIHSKQRQLQYNNPQVYRTQLTKTIFNE